MSPNGLNGLEVSDKVTPLWDKIQIIFSIKIVKYLSLCSLLPHFMALLSVIFYFLPPHCCSADQHWPEWFLIVEVSMAYLSYLRVAQSRESRALRLLLLLPPMAAWYRFQGAVCATTYCTSSAVLDVRAKAWIYTTTHTHTHVWYCLHNGMIFMLAMSTAAAPWRHTAKPDEPFHFHTMCTTLSRT